MGNDDFDMDLGFGDDIELGDAGDDFFGDANESSDDFGNGFNSFNTDTSVAGAGDPSSGNTYQTPDGYVPPSNFNNADSYEDDDGAAKRKAIILGVAGLILILITVGIAGIVMNKGSKKSKVKEEPIVREEVQIGQTSSSLNNTTSNSGWTEIDADTNLKFSDAIEATFTPTNVRHYVKTTTTGELEAKSVVTGSISGLTGTYELEIPYSQGIQLQRGMYFNIQYKISEINGKQIISDIVY